MILMAALGGTRAGVAVLDVDHHDDLRVLRRRVRNQPCVVFHVQLGSLRSTGLGGDRILGAFVERSAAVPPSSSGGNVFHAAAECRSK